MKKQLYGLESRARIAKSLGSKGDAIDTHWISRLDVNIDKRNKTIELKAPGEFVRYSVEERYLSHITAAIRDSGFELDAIRC